jgi:hypothetical protein
MPLTTATVTKPEFRRKKLEAEHGEGTVFNLHNEDDAKKPR